jgi:hypothetical protein
MTIGNTTELMSANFAVFNLHVNDAGKRADREFIRQFGVEEFDEHIKPYYDDGIMSIFEEPPNWATSAWVTLVTYFVNEDVPDAEEADPTR